MEKITLSRSGDRPVTFDGELISRQSTHHYDGPCNQRWHNLALYRTDKGKYVLHIDYTTCWQGEYGRSQASVHDDIESVAEELRMAAYEPPPLTGFPVGPQYDDKRQRVVEVMKLAWDEAVSGLLESLPEEL